MDGKQIIENVPEINFVNVKKSYFELLSDSNQLVGEYDELMRSIYSINIPLISSLEVLIFTNHSFQCCELETQQLMCKIRDFESKVNAWTYKAQKCYFDTECPPKLEEPEMLVNYIKQYNYLLDRIGQLISDIKVLYSSMNIKVDEINFKKDSVVGNKRFYIGLIIAFMGIILSFLIK